MNNWKEVINRYSFYPSEAQSHWLVLTEKDTIDIVLRQVQYVLEQIEEAKLSELGNVIEKLKEEYK